MVSNVQELMRRIELENIGKREPVLFKVGDTVKVYFKIIEGNRTRVQIFEGVVIRKRGSGIGKTFTVRKISYNIGVERVFPLYSPKIEKIEIIWHGKVRRAKLYYLRKRKGKAAQVKRLRIKKDEKSKKGGRSSKVKVKKEEKKEEKAEKLKG